MNQPLPAHVIGAPAVVDLVKADLDERDRVGTKTYGVRLQPGNGRNALQDAYEEALDQALYLKQAIEERKTNNEERWRRAFMSLRSVIEGEFQAYGVGDRPSAPPVWLTRLAIQADRLLSHASDYASHRTQSGGEDEG